MKIRIAHFVAKPGRGDLARHYWQPSAALRKAGWAPVRLSADLATAMAEAQAMNNRVAEWRAGKPAATPAAARKQVQKFAQRASVRELIRDFKEDRWPTLEASTQRTYQAALNVIDAWAGDQAVTSITAERCRVLLKELARPVPLTAAQASAGLPANPPRLHRASGIGRVLRTLLSWAVAADRLSANPMDKVVIRQGAPRAQIWPDHCIDAMVAMADALGSPSVALATLLGADTGQREGDILRLTWSKLPERDGQRHIRLRQGKTHVWIDVRLTARAQQRLAALDKANRSSATPAIHVITRDGTARWNEKVFVQHFAKIRAAAIEGNEALGLPPCPELEGLQFRDLRRTIIVRLAEAEVDLPGIAAISGHKIEACKKILEVYLPRTGRMAAAAIEKLEAHRGRQMAAKEQKEQQA